MITMPLLMPSSCLVAEAPDGSGSGAIFSPDQRHRYVAWRTWEVPREHDSFHLKYLAVIGLNPSTADHQQNDPTVTRCINFAKAWGYGALCMLNLFAFRATDPKVMKAETFPIGVYNDWALIKYTQGAGCGMTLAAWGHHGAHLGRSTMVRSMLRAGTLHCLKMTRGGEPGHPLYLRGDLKPEAMPPLACQP